MSGTDEDDHVPRPPKKRRLQWMSGQRVPQHLLKFMIQDLAEENDSDDESTTDNDDDYQDMEPNFQPLNDGPPGDGGRSEDSNSSSSDSTSSESSSSVSQMTESSERVNSGSSSSGSTIEERSHMTEELYPGAQLTRGQAVSKLLDLCCKHAASKALVSDLVQYTCELLPRNNSFPKTMYFFEQDIKPYIPPDLSVVHYCCEGCGSYLESGEHKKSKCDVCPKLGKETQLKSFYEFPLAGQIKYLFEERNLADAIDSYPVKVADKCDITKGEEYLRVKSNLSGKYDIVLMCSTDGLSPHKSSENQIWTITFTICEVPPQLRKVLTMVSQIWYGRKKPPMNAFLKPLSRSLQNLYRNGVKWTHPKTKEEHVSRGTGPVFTLDAPARAMVQNVTLYSGSFGCNICEIEGKYVFYGKGGKTIFPFEEDLVLRTKDAMKDQTKIVIEQGIVTKGVRGDSELNCIPLCDRSTALVYDYMHLVLLGVTKLFFSKWFGQKIKKKKGPNQPAQIYPWYIGNKSKVINLFLHSVKSTYELTRFPKDVEKYKNFKASTWLVWLLYLALLALHQHLPEEYFQHWILLVVSMHLLLQEEISENDLELARLLLAVFVEDSERLYGEDIMNYNVHGLLHLPLMVKRWGALWCNSTFLFEDYNGVITRNLHGTVHISEEFAHILGRHVANQTLKNVLHNDEEELSSNPQLKGRELYHNLSEEEFALLRQHVPNAKRTVPIHGRVQRGKTIFSSLCYSAEHATDNKTVVFNSEENTKVFGVVKFFYNNGGEILPFVNVLDVNNDLRFKHTATGIYVRHIIPTEVTDVICIVPFEQIIKKVIKIGCYVCVPPNSIERNL